jgi:putative membrane protein
MIEWYRSILAFHVIAIISWMAGILYLYRLLVYAAERRHEHPKIEELLQIMCRRLWKAITLPAMIASWIAGILMVYINPELLQLPWFQVKLLGVIIITGSTIHAGLMVQRVQKSESLPRGVFFRFMNEVPTLFMIVVVVMVIVKPWQ